jgi:hypothetical protein
VIVVGLVLRSFVRVDDGALVGEHWPGPRRSLELVLRAAGVPTGAVGLRGARCRSVRGGRR